MNEGVVTLKNVQGMYQHEFDALDKHPSSVNVHGGIVANIGEDQLTKWLHHDDRRLHLKYFSYRPGMTKGGAFPRPKYFESDRAGKVEFPEVTTIVMQSIAIAPYNGKWCTPYQWGWIVPKLETLYICVDHEWEKPKPTKLDPSMWNQIKEEQPALTCVQLLAVDGTLLDKIQSF